MKKKSAHRTDLMKYPGTLSSDIAARRKTATWKISTMKPGPFAPTIAHLLPLATLMVGLFTLTGASPIGTRPSAIEVTPTLGNYPNTSLPLSADTTVTPNAAPTNTTSINVSASTNFNGKLVANPATGVVRVTDAHPRGAYTVTLTAFSSSGGTASTTFTLTVTNPATCNAVNFAAGASPGADGRPRAEAVGDFNGDGKQDLAVVNFFSSDVSILLGDGAGNFSVATNFATGNHPDSVAVGDFNGDGKQDLAVANFFSNDVSILLGDGTGHFSAATNFGAGSSCSSIAVGDFNGDGKQDLVVANSGSANVSIFLGDGAGHFSAATNFGTGDTPDSVALGDFNGDGKQDLAVVNQFSNNVSILLGDGAGGFSAATNFAAGPTPYSVAVGDFNGDGKQDLVVANQNSGVSIFLGNGAGSFGAAINFGAGTNPFSVAVGDFNGDGNQDLAVANNGSSNVSILLGDGTGSFNAAINFGAGTNPYFVAVGDFNGDGKQDLAVANFSSNNVSILLRSCPPPALGNYPNTSLRLSTNTTIMPDAVPANTTSINVSASTNFQGNLAASPATGIVTVTDAHPGGTYPVTVKASGPGGTTTKTFTLTVTNGCQATASFTNAADVLESNDVNDAGPYSVAIGDFNGDGIQDLAMTSFFLNRVSIHLGDGSGGFPLLTEPGTGNGPDAIAIGDFNGDGKQDLAVANIRSNTVSILLGDGSGHFNGSTEVSVGNTPVAVAIGDFNGDGKLDVAVVNNHTATVSIRLGDGMGGLSGSTEVSVGFNPESIAVGDFNGDGKQDFATANDTTGGSSAGAVSIRLGDGLGGFSGSTEISVGTSPESIVVGDFNGDGKQDLAVANLSSNTVSILLGNGLGGFSVSTNVGVGNGPIAVTVGDFNGDGKQDFAVADTNPFSGGVWHVSVRLGDGLGGFSGGTELNVGDTPKSIAVGDFNGDGKQDLAVGNVGPRPGTVSIRLGQCFDTYTVTYNGNGNTGGTAPVDSNSPYLVNSTVTVLGNTGSLVKTGYTFNGWNTAANGSGTSYSPGATFHITSNVTLYARWTTATYTLTYTAGANGTISGASPQMVNYGGSGTAVTAVPNTGYHFVNWSDSSTANPRTDANVMADISVTANFAINTYTLTYTAGANGTISGTSPQTVNYGASGTAVTAVPNAGYHFVNWSDSSTANPRTDMNVMADISVTANFAITPALALATAVSRKTHGGAGDFDIDLLNANFGPECRSSGGNHTLVFTFTNNVTSGSASVTSGTGSVSGSPSFSGNTMTVSLTGVTDVQKITVTLSNVTDSFAQVLPNTAVSVNMLIGDVNGNKSVNGTDVSQTKLQSGSAVSAANFREDVNASGSINGTDVALVKLRSGSGLP